MVSLFCLIKRQEYKSSTKEKAKCYSFLERKDKGRKRCLLSVRIRRFAGRYEPRLIGRQESRLDSRDRAIFADCRGETEYFLVKSKNAKANTRETCKTKLLSGMTLENYIL